MAEGKLMMEPNAMFAVLHRIALRPYCETSVLAQGCVSNADVVDEILNDATREQLVVRREGRLSGWVLTPEGKDVHQRLLGQARSTIDGREVIVDAYETFVRLNNTLKRICTDWQVRGPDGDVVNDHSDAVYDAAICLRLAEFHDEVVPMLKPLSEIVQWFGSYMPRLQEALDFVLGGDTRYITAPMIDSYHTVWMEMHEDFLQTLGQVRDEKDGY
jgi:hypothetical protein